MTDIRAAWAKTTKGCWHLSASGDRDDYPVAIVYANRRHFGWTVWNRDRQTMAAYSRPNGRKAPRPLAQATAEAGAALLKRAAQRNGLGASNPAPGADRRAP